MKKDYDYDHMIVDDDGYTWYWDGERIYALDVDDPESYIDVGFIHRKGREAKTWEDAIKLLVIDGYISPEEHGDAYYNEQNYPFCSACGGTLEYMGILGNLIWLRCINCGLESNIKKERESNE